MSRQDNKYPNLISNSDRTPEQLREMGRKGGIKSGESRRRKREQEKRAKMMAEIMAHDPKVKKRLGEMAGFFNNLLK